MKRTIITTIAVVGGLAVGLSLSIGLPDWGGSGGDDDPPARLNASALRPVEVPPTPGAGADDPRAAVEGFLAAEVAGHLRVSFTFLSDAERRDYGTPAGWVAAHANAVPTIRSYEIETVRGNEVVTMLELEPGLDEVVGLVPGKARATWQTVHDADGWSVDLQASVTEPLLPSDSAAPNAVRRWAAARQRCTSTNERTGALVGFPALADELCGTTHPLGVGRATRLAEIDSSALTAAFGGGVTGWARVVPVDGPMPLRAVVAPIGETWTVIGVLTR